VYRSATVGRLCRGIALVTGLVALLFMASPDNKRLELPFEALLLVFAVWLGWRLPRRGVYLEEEGVRARNRFRTDHRKGVLSMSRRVRVGGRYRGATERSIEIRLGGLALIVLLLAAQVTGETWLAAVGVFALVAALAAVARKAGRRRVAGLDELARRAPGLSRAERQREVDAIWPTAAASGRAPRGLCGRSWRRVVRRQVDGDRPNLETGASETRWQARGTWSFVFLRHRQCGRQVRARMSRGILLHASVRPVGRPPHPFSLQKGPIHP
jgi:membrane protein implicated in regulation of membrane protease activity